jgi:hypothetical protein
MIMIALNASVYINKYANTHNSTKGASNLILKEKHFFSRLTKVRREARNL